MNDYLWDKSGQPDAEVERLEKLLSPYRGRDREPPRVGSRWGRGWAVAACAVLAAAGAWLATRGPLGEAEEWTVTRGDAPAAAVSAGEWIDTTDGSRAKLEVGRIGNVEIEPDSRLRVERARGAERRVRLERGEITAMIYAPARTFAVETPSATAIDLGCRYVLSVDAEGNGRLRVILGWVGFEREGREVFIPEGALCETRKSGGLGTPYYEDAPLELREALSRFDFSRGEVEAVLLRARRRDAMTLWHLLSKTQGQTRARVYMRLAELVRPPAGVTREAVVRGDARARDLWWNALGLEGVEWWRKWKGLLPPP